MLLYRSHYRGNQSINLLFPLIGLGIGFSMLWTGHYVIGALILLCELFTVPISLYEESMPSIHGIKKILIGIVFIAMWSIVLFDLLIFVYENWMLNRGAIDTTAVIINKKNSSRLFSKAGSEYYLLLKYVDDKNVSHTNKYQVFKDEYYSVEIKDIVKIKYSEKNTSIIIIPSFKNSFNTSKNISSIVFFSVVNWVVARLRFKLGLKN